MGGGPRRLLHSGGKGAGVFRVLQLQADLGDLLPAQQLHGVLQAQDDGVVPGDAQAPFRARALSRQVDARHLEGNLLAAGGGD